MVSEQEESAREEFGAPEGWHRTSEHPDVKRPFPEVLSEQMEVQGIAGLEDLWERFQDSGERLQRWCFMRNCEGASGGADARYVRGVTRALGYDPRSEEAGRIALCYTGLFGEKL